MNPTDYRYTKEHEWVSAQGPIATVGITDYGQKQLGDIVFVQLPKVGMQLKAGEAFGSIESVKAVSDLLAPVSGEVTNVNSKLADAPDVVNKDPYGAAWLLKLRLRQPDETSVLMDAESYEAYTEDLAK
jgi:glycine cleavage system H protein